MTGSVALEEVAAPPDTDTPPDTPLEKQCVRIDTICRRRTSSARRLSTGTFGH